MLVSKSADLEVLSDDFLDFSSSGTVVVGVILRTVGIGVVIDYLV